MASVAKFKLNEAPRLLAHCSRSQKNAGSHIHQYRSAMNFNMAKDRHQGVGDYQFVKDTINMTLSFINVMTSRSSAAGL